MYKLACLALSLATLAFNASAQYGRDGGPAPIQRSAAPKMSTLEPLPGVSVRSDSNASVRLVGSGTNSTEIRIERGRANVLVNHPSGNPEILVDLPGGQLSLVRDGLYTFNAETNTARIFNGEADAYLGTNTDARPIKVKSDQQIILAANAHPLDVDPRRPDADLLPGGWDGARDRGEGYPRGAYGYGPYGDGYAAYPGYVYPAYAYGFGYPYAFGYPYPHFGGGLGFGFGYYGGFRGGYGGYGRFGRR